MRVDNSMVTSSRGLPSTRHANERAAQFLVASMAIGEMSVGMVILVLPLQVALALVDAVLDARGSIVARMMGIAVLALGVTWWQDRGDTPGLARYGAGFIVYNLGVGALFCWAALTASQPAIPWIVSVAHLAAGMAFMVLVWRNPLS